MQLAGFFVEYLIIGSTSLLWILPLLYAADIPVPENKTLLVLIAPALYVLGMIIDVSGHYITLKHRRQIKEKAKKKYCKRYGVTKIDLGIADADLMAFSSALGKSAIARNSRARVARGSLTNVLIGSPLCLLVFLDNLSVGEVGIALIVGILTVGGLWKIWARWQRLSYRFEIKAIAILQKKTSR